MVVAIRLEKVELYTTLSGLQLRAVSLALSCFVWVLLRIYHIDLSAILTIKLIISSDTATRLEWDVVRSGEFVPYAHVCFHIKVFFCGVLHAAIVTPSGYQVD